MSPGLVDPLPLVLRRGLRALVMELTTLGRTQRFPASVSVGVPGADRVTWTVDPGASDHALRADVVAALVGRFTDRLDTRGDHAGAVPVCWLTRPGVTSWHDLDADWLPAAETAYAERGEQLTFVVVTKTAWWDPRSDVRRSWRRPRPRVR